MQYLLLPEDEDPFVSFMTHELGLVPLGLDVAGSPLPRQDAPSIEVWDHVFWAEHLGPVHRLREATTSDDPRDQVMNRLNQEAYRDDWGEAVDLARTPVIRFARCNWHLNGHLCPGRLGACARSTEGLSALHRRVRRWLEAEGERLNPFEHCTASPAPQPKNLAMFRTWARPHALEWVHCGGKVWPWNA